MNPYAELACIAGIIAVCGALLYGVVSACNRKGGA